MITIPVSEIKKFISAAKPIKDTRLLPIYAYVKLVCEGNQGIFYKSNGTSFVVCYVSAEFEKNETLLIEEKTLFGFAQYSSGKSIKISKKGDSVLLDDGTRTMSCTTAKNEHFPAIQAKDSEESIIFDENVISALFLAKNHTADPVDATMRPPASFVHVTKVDKHYYVAAWCNAIAYLKQFKEKLPTVSLDPETISVISRFNLLSYSRCGNYDYFDGGEVAYGFIKTECKMPDVTLIVNNFKHKKTFTFDRKPLVDFCEMVINVNSSSVPPEVSISNFDQNNIMLRFTDASENQQAKENVFFTGETDLTEPFYFQPKHILTMLKELRCEKVTFSYVQKNFIVTSDEEKGYVGAIMELAKQ